MSTPKILAIVAIIWLCGIVAWISIGRAIPATVAENVNLLEVSQDGHTHEYLRIQFIDETTRYLIHSPDCKHCKVTK